jgi:glycosyltransferase involved in cell wall biosynthesis
VRARYDVCAAVVSDLAYDARAWKEARSLAGAGYRVALCGCRYGIDRSQRRAEGDIDVFEACFGARRRAFLRARRVRALLMLWLEILRTPAGVYHAHNVHVAVPVYLAARIRRARFVYDAHELYGETAGRHGLGARLAAIGASLLERTMVGRSDAVITTNPSRAATLRSRYGRADVEVLANVPAVVEDVVPLDPGFPAGRPLLLYQGGVYPESRAFEETVRALALLPDAELVILGFGRPELFAEIRAWAEQSGVSARVHFLPPRPFDELVRTAAAATVGLVPIRPDSYGSYLGDTNKLHEYLMAGLPVAASDLPEIRRVVTQGDPAVGELFDPSSPESIAAAIAAVLDPERYEARRAEARRLALECHHWGLEERKLRSLYARLLPLPGLPARSAEATA